MVGLSRFAGIRGDFGMSERLQLSGFFSEADDPLYSSIIGRAKIPGNFWSSYGAAVKWKLATPKEWEDPSRTHLGWNLAFVGSIEGWDVGSGGCDSKACKGQPA